MRDTLGYTEGKISESTGQPEVRSVLKDDMKNVITIMPISSYTRHTHILLAHYRGKLYSYQSTQRHSRLAGRFSKEEREVQLDLAVGFMKLQGHEHYQTDKSFRIY